MSFEDYKERMTRQLLGQRVIGQEVTYHVQIPEAELKKYYDEHQSEFLRKEEVYLSQILISTEGKTPEQVATAEKKAKDLVARARKGEKFTDLVRDNSDDPETARNGGALPPYQRGFMPKQMEDVVFKANKGDVPDPFKVAQGFLILKVEERHEAGTASFDEVKEDIHQKLAAPRWSRRSASISPSCGRRHSCEIKDGYVDSGAAPGKDTRWQDVAQLKPETTTKEEVAARAGKPHKKLIFIPIPGTTKSDSRRGHELGGCQGHGGAQGCAGCGAPAEAGHGQDRRHSANHSMKSPYVNELEPNRVIMTSFLVHSKEVRQKKSGELYLSLLLGDRTGELDAKMWDNVAEVMDGFDRDDFVKVKGLIQVFHNRPQLTIHKLRRMDDSEIDFADYFPSSRRDADEMWSELRGIVSGIGNPHLKALLERLLDDEDVSRAVPPRAGRQADPPRIPGRPDRARAFAVHAGPRDGGALSDRGCGPADRGRGAARYRQDLRAELRARIFVFQRRAVAGPHQHRDANGGGQAARATGFSGAAAGAGGAHDPEPSRATGVRISQTAAVSRSAAAALSRRHGFEDGVHAGADRERPAGGRLLHDVQSGAGACGIEEGPLPEWSGAFSTRAGRGADEWNCGGAGKRCGGRAGRTGAGSGGCACAGSRAGGGGAPVICRQAGFGVRR